MDDHPTVVTAVMESFDPNNDDGDGDGDDGDKSGDGNIVGVDINDASGRPTTKNGSSQPSGDDGATATAARAINVGSNNNNNNGNNSKVGGSSSKVSNSKGNDDTDDDAGTDNDMLQVVTQALAPSHILEDGRFVYLPPPNAAERSRFFERAIARHGLLEADLSSGSVGPSEEPSASSASTTNPPQPPQQAGEEKDPTNDGEGDGTTTTAIKVHPLAIASARLQANGLNELNRAINLATLVSTGEYFSYSNVVDPSLEAPGAGAGTTGAGEGSKGSKSTAAASATTATATAPTTAAAAEKTDAAGDRGTVPPAAGAVAGGAASSTAAASPPTPATAATQMTRLEEQEGLHQRTAALYCLKRKRGQYERASAVLTRHASRLEAAITAQRVLDRRLFQLRHRWRLVAPEHGTRARLHAARTNEVIAVDVDVYDRDRVVVAAAGAGGDGKKRAAAPPGSLAGRLASRVPRFATIELKDGFSASKLTNAASAVASDHNNNNNTDKDKDGDIVMGPADQDSGDGSLPKRDDAKSAPNAKDAATDTDEEANKAKKGRPDADVTIDAAAVHWTRAEPFAVADPTLGRVMENFDPTKIPMLNLQLDVQKSSTGFLQSARLDPLHTAAVATTTAGGGNGNVNGDEELLVSLQHSLFCANLFESIRSELDPESYQHRGGQQGEQQQQQTGRSNNNNTAAGPSFSPARNRTLHQGMAWLAAESEENFLPPPSFLAGLGDDGRGLAALAVVHCHEGEVKVQLDCEYTLCVRLVEANAEREQERLPRPLSPRAARRSSPTTKARSDATAATNGSGSQSPAQLHALCRALLLHAQDVYHRHSLYLRRREAQKRRQQEEEAVANNEPRGLARIKREDVPEQACILQSCVSLGSKMLLERRTRAALSRVARWVLQLHNADDAAASHPGHEGRIVVEWLPLSIFDLHSRCTVCFRSLLVDVEITRDGLTVTRITDSGDYRKAHFRSETEFEMHLKLAIRRQM